MRIYSSDEKLISNICVDLCETIVTLRTYNKTKPKMKGRLFKQKIKKGIITD